MLVNKMQVVLCDQSRETEQGEHRVFTVGDLSLAVEPHGHCCCCSLLTSWQHLKQLSTPSFLKASSKSGNCVTSQFSASLCSVFTGSFQGLQFLRFPPCSHLPYSSHSQWSRLFSLYSALLGLNSTLHFRTCWAIMSKVNILTLICQSRKLLHWYPKS